MKTTVITSNGIATDKDKNALAASAPSAKAAGSAITPNPKFDDQAGEVKPAENGAAGAKAPAAKQEVKAAGPEVKAPALNLDSTIRLAQDLTRKISQRSKLLDTIGTLEDFELAQKEDMDETASNAFQRCHLTIEDDMGRKFVTKNAYIIASVATHVNTLCLDKLAEVESGIYIPSN